MTGEQCVQQKVFVVYGATGYIALKLKNHQTRWYYVLNIVAHQSLHLSSAYLHWLSLPVALET